MDTLVSLFYDWRCFLELVYFNQDWNSFSVEKLIHYFFFFKSSFHYFAEVSTSARFVGIKSQPIQQGQISPCDCMGKSNFIPARRNSFPLGICLDFLILLRKHVSNYFFILLRWAEAITWENFALAKWDFLHVIAGYNLWKVYNTAGIVVIQNFNLVNWSHVITSLEDKLWDKSFIKIKNKSGTKIDPCGTPAWTSVQGKFWPLSTNLCFVLLNPNLGGLFRGLFSGKGRGLG